MGTTAISLAAMACSSAAGEDAACSVVADHRSVLARGEPSAVLADALEEIAVFEGELSDSARGYAAGVRAFLVARDDLGSAIELGPSVGEGLSRSGREFDAAVASRCDNGRANQ